jgi:hypothetical protein
VSYDRQSRRSNRRDDDWVPPAWNNPIPERADRPVSLAQSDTDGDPARSKSADRAPARPHESGIVLGLAVAPLGVGLLAFLASLTPILSGGGSVPRGLLLIALVQVIAASLLHATDQTSLMHSWTATLISSAVLVPLLALQVTLLREPYVSWSRGSASPSMVATLIVAMVLTVGAVWAVAVSWSEPDVAGLLFMPQAMVVPAMVGMRNSIQLQPALEMLGRVLLLTAMAMAVAWILPSATRVLVPPFAVAIEFVLLWVTGYGPWFHETSGDIVRILYSVMLALAVVLVVAVPFVALWLKHGASAMITLRRQAMRAHHRSRQDDGSPQLKV